MTNDKGKDLIEEVIVGLAAYAEKADDEGLIVEVPMTPSYYPPVRYKRVGPQTYTSGDESGVWFVWLEGAKRWEPQVGASLEHIFQVGIEEGKKWAGY